jgi:hypothetical protein
MKAFRPTALVPEFLDVSTTDHPDELLDDGCLPGGAGADTG